MIGETAAPTFSEGERARCIIERFAAWFVLDRHIVDPAPAERVSLFSGFLEIVSQPDLGGQFLHDILHAFFFCGIGHLSIQTGIGSGGFSTATVTSPTHRPLPAGANGVVCGAHPLNEPATNTWCASTCGNASEKCPAFCGTCPVWQAVDAGSAVTPAFSTLLSAGVATFSAVGLAVAFFSFFVVVLIITFNRPIRSRAVQPQSVHRAGKADVMPATHRPLR